MGMVMPGPAVIVELPVFSNLATVVLFAHMIIVLTAHGCEIPEDRKEDKYSHMILLRNYLVGHLEGRAMR